MLLQKRTYDVVLSLLPLESAGVILHCVFFFYALFVDLLNTKLYKHAKIPRSHIEKRGKNVTSKYNIIK